MEEKPVEWMGSSRRDLRAFPAEARGEAGQNLLRVQHGKAPKDWRPMQSVGPGASEIRVHSWTGGRVEHRVVKTHSTAPGDLQTARERYREVLDRRGKGD